MAIISASKAESKHPSTMALKATFSPLSLTKTIPQPLFLVSKLKLVFVKMNMDSLASTYNVVSRKLRKERSEDVYAIITEVLSRKLVPL